MNADMIQKIYNYDAKAEKLIFGLETETKEKENNSKTRKKNCGVVYLLFLLARCLPSVATIGSK